MMPGLIVLTRAPRLRGDNDARSVACNDVAEFLEHERGAIQIDLEDRGRRCLGGGDTGGMDDAGYVADRRGGLDERVDRCARGDIDDSGAHLEPGVAQDFCGRIDVMLAQISQQDALA